MSKYNKQINLRSAASFSGFSIHWWAWNREWGSYSRRECSASFFGRRLFQMELLGNEHCMAWAQRARLALWELRNSQMPVGYPRLCGPLPTHCSHGSHENLFLIHPCVQPAGRGVCTRLWVGCWQWMPHMPQESQMNAWYGEHAVFSNIII